MNHQEIAARFRQELVAKGWVVQHDYVGDFLVRRGDEKVSVKVEGAAVCFRKFAKTAKGGFKVVSKHSVIFPPNPDLDSTASQILLADIRRSWN